MKWLVVIAVCGALLGGALAEAAVSPVGGTPFGGTDFVPDRDQTTGAVTTVAPQGSSGKGEYTPIVPFPGLPSGKASTLGELLNAVFRLAITAGGILAVLYIMYGGYQYLASEAIGGKKDGKETIQKALIGLILLLLSYLILYVINPDILNLEPFESGVTAVNKTTPQASNTASTPIAQPPTTGAQNTGTPSNQQTFSGLTANNEASRAADQCRSDGKLTRTTYGCANTQTSSGAPVNCFGKGASTATVTCTDVAVGDTAAENTVKKFVGGQTTHDARAEAQKCAASGGYPQTTYSCANFKSQYTGPQVCFVGDGTSTATVTCVK